MFNGIYIRLNKIRLVKDNIICCNVNGIDGELNVCGNRVVDLFGVN